MGRKISRKQKNQSKYKSKQYYKQTAGSAQVVAGPATVLQQADVAQGAQAAQSDFSETMKKYDNIRRMIEDLKYDGNNLARYNERKNSARTIREACVAYLRKLKKTSHNKQLKLEGTRLTGKITGKMAAMQKFSNQSTLGAITSGKKKTEIYRLVMECRKRGIEAVYEQLNKDLSSMRYSISQI